jgi:hypothetical protein
VVTVVLSAHNVAGFPEGGGHFWVYLQYALALRRAGCEVYWLEAFRRTGDRFRDAEAVATFIERTKAYGFDKRALLYVEDEGQLRDGSRQYVGVSSTEAEEAFRRADLLLNFHYVIDPELLARFKRTALVDIDPGLLQFWMSNGQLAVPPHDVYFTVGETVGTPAASFPDCGLDWVHIRPPVCLEWWPYVHDPGIERFTTVAGWWGGEWLKETEGGRVILRENTKRMGFLEFVELPQHTAQPLELALLMAADDTEDRRELESHGWHLRRSCDVAGTPATYRDYIRGSRGEFSCAKPSTVRSQNAWVSDRTACYLASGKPVVVQNTGPSSYLPNGEGMFRFSTIAEAAAALEAVNADYERHCRAARALAERHFDATSIIQTVLDVSLA